MVLNILIIAGAVLSAVWTLAMQINPINRGIVYWLNEQIPNAVPDAYVLARMYQRGIIDADTYKNAIKKLGLAEDWALKLALENERFPEVYDLISMLRRGLIDKADFVSTMQKLGIREKWGNCCF